MNSYSIKVYNVWPCVVIKYYYANGEHSSPFVFGLFFLAYVMCYNKPLHLFVLENCGHHLSSDSPDIDTKNTKTILNKNSQTLTNNNILDTTYKQRVDKAFLCEFNNTPAVYFEMTLI